MLIVGSKEDPFSFHTVKVSLKDSPDFLFYCLPSVWSCLEAPSSFRIHQDTLKYTKMNHKWIMLWYFSLLQLILRNLPSWKRQLRGRPQCKFLASMWGHSLYITMHSLYISWLLLLSPLSPYCSSFLNPMVYDNLA